MTRRWPLHPPPGEGEALTSWLSRLAQVYGMSVEDLVRHDLTPPGVEHLDHLTSALDLDPPHGVLPALAERTGVPLDQLRRMTIGGWVPWLLDTLDAEPAPGATFDSYVHQDSVLLTAKERPRRQVPRWRAWLPTDPKRGPLHRACPTCLSAGTPDISGFTLVSQLPLTRSCPEHGCHLELAFGGLGAFVAWEEPDTRATAAPETVAAMDRRTHEALRTGAVLLPRRSVHAGVWFRLLRTLIDELSTPVSALGTRSRRAVHHIWQVTGHPPRAGIVGPWRPYEALPWPQQRAFLEAAAAALHLTEGGEISARGTLAPLLTAEPDRHVDRGTPPAQDRRELLEGGQGRHDRGHGHRPARPSLSPAAADHPHGPDPERGGLPTHPR